MTVFEYCLCFQAYFFAEIIIFMYCVFTSDNVQYALFLDIRNSYFCAVYVFGQLRI